MGHRFVGLSLLLVAACSGPSEQDPAGATSESSSEANLTGAPQCVAQSSSAQGVALASTPPGITRLLRLWWHDPKNPDGPAITTVPFVEDIIRSDGNRVILQIAAIWGQPSPTGYGTPRRNWVVFFDGDKWLAYQGRYSTPIGTSHLINLSAVDTAPDATHLAGPPSRLLYGQDFLLAGEHGEAIGAISGIEEEFTRVADGMLVVRQPGQYAANVSIIFPNRIVRVDPPRPTAEELAMKVPCQGFKPSSW